MKSRAVEEAFAPRAISRRGVAWRRPPTLHRSRLLPIELPRAELGRRCFLLRILPHRSCFIFSQKVGVQL
uniref:Uncharacterized protein n=1 Tax=Leersia perrieri TaxID=77586 RepID=A0A0D9WVJ3_9ORYZ